MSRQKNIFFKFFKNPQKKNKKTLAKSKNIEYTHQSNDWGVAKW